MMVKTIQRNILRADVGRAIFCQGGCGHVMDCREAVSMDIKQGDRIIKSMVRCGNCHDTLACPGWFEWVSGRGYTTSVLDGRKLFAKSPAAMAAPKAQRRARIKLEPGKVYRVKHASGEIRWRFHLERLPWGGKRNHYHGTNLRTGREVILKSTARVLGPTE